MRVIRLRGTHIQFPRACLACLGYPSREYTIERTFIYGRNSRLLRLPIPLCQQHFIMATAKSKSQIWCERLSLVAAIVLGLAVFAGLLMYWSASGLVSTLLNILVAGVGGICMAVTLWAILFFWMAPLFVSSAAREIQKSVRITKYDPFRQILELVFTNDTAAVLTERENIPLLIAEEQEVRCYRISAHLLDHDIRYNNTLETRVLLDHKPSEEEALVLLQPVIECVMVQQMGVGTFYETDSIEIMDAAFESMD